MLGSAVEELGEGDALVGVLVEAVEASGGVGFVAEAGGVFLEGEAAVLVFVPALEGGGELGKGEGLGGGRGFGSGLAFALGLAALHGLAGLADGVAGGAGGKGGDPGEGLGGEVADEVGLLRGEVGVLAGVVGDVVKLGVAALVVGEELPGAFADGEGRGHEAVVGTLDAEQPLPVERGGAGALGAEPDVADVLAIGLEVGRQGDAGELAEGGEEIDGAGDAGAVDAASGDLAGPADEAERADAAFVHGAFAGAERAGAAGTGVGGIGDAVVFGAVVAGEEEEGVLGELEFVEAVEQAADLGVEVGEGGAEDLHLAAEVFGAGEVVFHPGAVAGLVGGGGEVGINSELLGGGLEQGVGEEGPGVDVEGLVAVGADEGEGFVDDELGGAGAEVGLGGFVAQGGAVGVDGLGGVEAVGLRGGSAGAAAEVPFAKVRGGVAGGLEEAGEGGDLGVEPVGHGTGGVLRGAREVTVDAVTGGRVGGHESGTAGRADGGGDVKLLEPGAFAGEAVEVGCLDVRVAGKGGVAKALVIGEDEDDVGGALRAAGGLVGQKEAEREAEEGERAAAMGHAAENVGEGRTFRKRRAAERWW